MPQLDSLGDGVMGKDAVVSSELKIAIKIFNEFPVMLKLGHF